MPEVGCQTDRDQALALMECRVHGLSIMLQNGWKRFMSPPGLEFIITKSFCEGVFFEHHPANYKFSDDEWDLVKLTAQRLLENKCYPDYAVSDEREINHIVKNITWTALGFPIHIVELVYTQGLLVRNYVNRYDIRIPVGENKLVSSIVVDEIREIFFEEHLYGLVGYEDMNAIVFKALHTVDGEFERFRGNPLDLPQRSLETYLHLNLNDEDVPPLYDDILLDYGTNLPFQALQMYMGESVFDEPFTDENDSEDETLE